MADISDSTPAAFAEPPNVDVATEQLAEVAPKAIVFAFTSSSYVLGANADDSTRARLEARAGGIPVVMTCPAATDALRALAVKRVALVNPPWFKEDVSAKGGDYFRAQGFDVVLCERLAPTRLLQTEVRPEEVFEWVRTHTPAEAQAVLIGGNGLRAVGAIRALETTLRKPVLTANQVAFWAALRAAKVRATIADYGGIFQKDH
jgi:maleate isomerase